MDKQAKEELDARTVKLKSHTYNNETLNQARILLSEQYAREHEKQKFTSSAPKLILLKLFKERKPGLIRAFVKDAVNQVKILLKYEN